MKKNYAPMVAALMNNDQLESGDECDSVPEDVLAVWNVLFDHLRPEQQDEILLHPSGAANMRLLKVVCDVLDELQELPTADGAAN